MKRLRCPRCGQQQRRMTKTERLRKEMRIATLRERGFMQREIGERVGLSQLQVSDILRSIPWDENKFHQAAHARNAYGRQKRKA